MHCSTAGSKFSTQSRDGYRVSLDAALLAHFVRVKPDAKIVELGAGNGAIILMLAYRHPSARLTGVEIQAALLARARRNVVLNGLQERGKNARWRCACRGRVGASGKL